MKYTIEQIIYMSTLISWHGYDMEHNPDHVENITHEEIMKHSNSLNSMDSAIKGVEKYLLNGHKIDRKYVTGEGVTKEETEKYFSKLSSYVKHNVSKEDAYKAAVFILDDIHKTWVIDNAKKYNRDAEKEDKRLYQHLPTYLIGVEEASKDLLFVAPLLEAMGINTGHMELTPYGSFIPCDELKNAYKELSNQYLEEKGLNNAKLKENLVKVIESYEPLNNGEDKELIESRKEYMIDRVDLLANQMNKNLQIESIKR